MRSFKIISVSPSGMRYVEDIKAEEYTTAEGLVRFFVNNKVIRMYGIRHILSIEVVP